MIRLEVGMDARLSLVIEAPSQEEAHARLAVVGALLAPGMDLKGLDCDARLDLVDGSIQITTLEDV